MASRAAAGVPYFEEVVVEEGGGESVEDVSSNVVVYVHYNGGELVGAEVVGEYVGVEEVQASAGGLNVSLDRVRGGGEVVEDEKSGRRVAGRVDFGDGAAVWVRRGDGGSPLLSRCRC